jgi:hypothetical protein
VDAEAAAGVFALRPLTESLVKRLNPEVSLAGLAESLTATGLWA